MIEKKQGVLTGVRQTNIQIYALLSPQDLQNLRGTCVGIKNELDGLKLECQNSKGKKFEGSFHQYIQSYSAFFLNKQKKQLCENQLSKVQGEKHHDNLQTSAFVGALYGLIGGVIGGFVAFSKLGSILACVGITGGGGLLGTCTIVTAQQIRIKYCLPNETTLDEEAALLQEEIDNGPTSFEMKKF